MKGQGRPSPFNSFTPAPHVPSPAPSLVALLFGDWTPKMNCSLVTKRIVQIVDSLNACGLSYPTKAPQIRWSMCHSKSNSCGKGVNKKGDKEWLKGEGVQSKVNVTGSFFLTLISPAILFSSLVSVGCSCVLRKGTSV